MIPVDNYLSLKPPIYRSEQDIKNFADPNNSSQISLGATFKVNARSDKIQIGDEPNPDDAPIDKEGYKVVSIEKITTFPDNPDNSIKTLTVYPDGSISKDEITSQEAPIINAQNEETGDNYTIYLPTIESGRSPIEVWETLLRDILLKQLNLKVNQVDIDSSFLGHNDPYSLLDILTAYIKYMHKWTGRTSIHPYKTSLNELDIIHDEEFNRTIQIYDDSFENVIKILVNLRFINPANFNPSNGEFTGGVGAYANEIYHILTVPFSLIETAQRTGPWPLRSSFQEAGSNILQAKILQDLNSMNIDPNKVNAKLERRRLQYVIDTNSFLDLSQIKSRYPWLIQLIDVFNSMQSFLGNPLSEAFGTIITDEMLKNGVTFTELLEAHVNYANGNYSEVSPKIQNIFNKLKDEGYYDVPPIPPNKTHQIIVPYSLPIGVSPTGDPNEKNWGQFHIVHFRKDILNDIVSYRTINPVNTIGIKAVVTNPSGEQVNGQVTIGALLRQDGTISFIIAPDAVLPDGRTISIYDPSVSIYVRTSTIEDDGTITTHIGSFNLHQAPSFDPDNGNLPPFIPD